MSRTTALCLLLCGAVFPSIGMATATGQPPILTVGGSGSGCQYTDLQTAIDDAGAQGAEIHLHTDYVGPPVSINNTQNLSLIGGFFACSDTKPRGISRLDGTLRSSDSPVVSIQQDQGVVQIANLTIVNGHNANGAGGGIAFVGAGELDIANVLLLANDASDGGGLYVHGNDAVVRLKALTEIRANRAHNTGAGIHIDGAVTLFMVENNTVIDFNIADVDTGVATYGGGLYVEGANAHAEIAATQYGQSSIQSNNAIYGGGIAAMNGGVVRLFSLTEGQPTRLQHNSSVYGGGVYVGAAGEQGSPVLCGFGYDISQNSAQDGAAILVDNDENGGGKALLTLQDRDAGEECGPPDVTAGAPACAALSTCNSMTLNQGVAGGLGAIVSIKGGSLRAEALDVRTNVWGGAVINGSADASVDLKNCLVAENLSLSREVIRMEDGAAISFDGCTIANNAGKTPNDVADGVTGPLTDVLSLVGGAATVTHSIVWDPGYDSLLLQDGHGAYTDVLVNDASLLATQPLDGFTNVHDFDPGFINPDTTSDFNTNYRLSPDSPAIDYASTPVSLALDLDGRPRGVPLANADSPFDIGAYERHGYVPAITFPPDEDFTEMGNVEEPQGTLPQGWTSAHTGDGAGWSTTVRLFANNPYPPDFSAMAAFTPDVFTVGDSTLDSPAFPVGNNARVFFRHNISLEDSAIPGMAFDGAVLEIRIGDEPAFRDILEAGGRFVSGGYNRTLFDADITGCPLGGRRAWSGDSAGYRDVSVDLPAAANGQTVQLRWRVGTDSSGFDNPVLLDGYWVNAIHIEPDGPADEIIFSDGFEAF